MSIVTLAMIVMVCAALSYSETISNEGGLRVQNLGDVGRLERSSKKTGDMDLEHVQGAAVCPIVVSYDDDENRIPNRIKNLKCGATPNPICKFGRLKDSCCQTRGESSYQECVNIVDTALVRYTNRGDESTQHKIRVFLGCTCMIREHNKAIDDRSSSKTGVTL